VNTVQEDWKKDFFGTGLLVENNEVKDGNFLKKCASAVALAPSCSFALACRRSRRRALARTCAHACRLPLRHARLVRSAERAVGAT
jgi:hypothetical protein